MSNVSGTVTKTAATAPAATLVSKTPAPSASVPSQVKTISQPVASAPVATVAPKVSVAAAPSASVPSQVQSIPSTVTYSEPNKGAGVSVSSSGDGAPPLATGVNGEFNLSNSREVVPQEAIYHDVQAPSDTSNADLGAEVQSFTSADMARFGAYDRALNAPSVVSDYLATDYGSVATGPVDMSQYMPTVNGRTSFDFQREGINAQFAAEVARQSEQIDAMLAAQGVTGPAAAAAKAQMIAAMNGQQATMLQDVNQQEAKYMQDAAMAEAARRFSREERLGEQAFTADLTYAQLNQNERQLAEQGRQFDNKQEFDAWAEENKYTNEERTRVWTAIQNDENRRLDAAGLQQKVDGMRNDLAYQYEQLASTTGVQRDQIMAGIYNNMQDIASAERQLAYRNYADQTLASLNSDLEMGNWVDQNAITQRQTAFFNLGKGGTALDDGQLQTLKTEDPLAYYAYMDGVGNLSQAEFNANVDLRNQILGTAISGLADLTGIDLQRSIQDTVTLFSDLFEGGLAGGLVQGSTSGRGVTVVSGASGSGGVNIVGQTATTATTGVTIGGVRLPTPVVPTSGSQVVRQSITNTPDSANGVSWNSGFRVVGSNGALNYVHKITVPYPEQRVGELTLYRGSADQPMGAGLTYGDGSIDVNTAGYTPPNALNSPASNAYIANIGNLGPYNSQQFQYTFDAPTLNAALTNVIGSMAADQPYPMTDYDWEGIDNKTSLTPQDMLVGMMISAGRPVQVRLSNGVDSVMSIDESGNWTMDGSVLDGGNGSTRQGSQFFAPAPENYMLIDIDHFRSTSPAEAESVVGQYANIGGQPYAIVPNWDPQTGETIPGSLAVSLVNPQISIPLGQGA